MSDLAARIGSLPPEKRALLAARLSTSGHPTVGRRRIPSRDRSVPAPLSYTQRGIWFLDQLYPNNVAYNAPIALRFVGSLDTTAFEWSFNQILSRHDLLRARFALCKGDPVQYETSFRPARLSTISFDDIPPSARMEAARAEAVHEARRPLNLVRGPLWRAKLLRCSEHEHIFVMVLHHIICDGWSIGVLVRELFSGYERFLRGDTSPLPTLSIQYADYAVWQQQELAGASLQRQVQIWRERLEGAASTHLIPLDKPRPAEPTFRGERVSAHLPRELTESLQQLARREGATLFMVLLAAFKVLLSRYSGETDVVVGSPIANRERSELESLIGFFANTMALRTDLSGDPPFVQLLAKVREVTLNAYNSQEVPFEKLVEELRPERQLNRNPFFDVSFSFQNLPSLAVSASDLEVELLRIDNGTSKFDLSLVIVEAGDRLMTTVEYSIDLFDPSMPVRLLESYKVLLEAIVEKPRGKISQLPLLSPSERNRIVFEWNETDRDFPRDQCIQELFETQVEQTPEAVSVVFEDQQLSYHELNRRANQLAHYLQRLGVGPEVLVGVMLARSLEMIVAMLGVLKAGGAYVPLDPNYPAARLAFMLQDAKVSMLIGQERTVSTLIEPPAAIISMDRDWLAIARESARNPHLATKPTNLAYVVYTSGSTGQPKGVAVEHRQLTNYLHGILELLKLPRNASFATVSTFAADLGNTVVFASLCGGGTLHVISEERSADADALGDYFSRHAIDCLKIVPSHLAALQNGTRSAQVLPRKALILGGEASRLDWIKGLRSLNPRCVVMNHYGPTEATVGVLTYRVEADAVLTELKNLPLGRPIFNTKIYLLDQHLNPVPVGVAGELHIGGLCLARGYLNHPELTAERFIPHPFTQEAGGRLYKSGDLARYLPDGNIEFLGRVDDQIKIRGFRVEPREIEGALEQHPGVTQVAVLTARDQFDENRLVAYVVPKEPDRMIGAKQRYVLPNGMAVSHLNRNETDYLYDEIFKRQAYFKHGITLKDGDCIFDVGANIGLFTLCANQICRQSKIYAFEPNPSAWEILTANASLYAPSARIFPCGLSNESKTATLTFFPEFSLFSGFYADPLAEKELVKTYMANQQKAGASEMADMIADSDDLLNVPFSCRAIDAPLRALSEIIEEESIESIDLLKINVEKSELDVLRGIEEADWAKIKQIVLEADTKDNLQAITVLLEGHGYDLSIDQDVLLENTQLYYVYAIRPSSERRMLRKSGETAHIQSLPDLDACSLSTANLRNFLQQRLPDYMVPAAFVLLEKLPLTSTGKIDRQGLPAPAVPGERIGTILPRSATEKMVADAWSAVIDGASFGVYDDFFQLGGHSLLAMRVVSRLRSACGWKIPLRIFFENATVAAMAEYIEGVRRTGGKAARPPLVADREELVL